MTYYVHSRDYAAMLKAGSCGWVADGIVHYDGEHGFEPLVLHDQTPLGAGVLHDSDPRTLPAQEAIGRRHTERELCLRQELSQ